MIRNLANIKVLQRICNGDAEGMDFLGNHWIPYCEGIDDIIDGDITAPEDVLAIFAKAIELYSHPFYLRNAAGLRQVARNVTSTYADTVAWEKSTTQWKRTWADNNRHCSLEMAIAVATITGGYAHARAIMPELRTIAYAEHHNPDGSPS